MRPSEIEPATYRLVAQCLNQLQHTRKPSWNPTFNTPKFDCLRHDRVFTCVVAQQYFSPTFFSFRFHPPPQKKKICALFENAIIPFFFFFNSPSLKWRNLNMPSVCIAASILRLLRPWRQRQQPNRCTDLCVGICCTVTNLFVPPYEQARSDMSTAHAALCSSQLSRSYFKSSWLLPGMR